MSKSKIFIGIAICFSLGVLIASAVELLQVWVYIFLAVFLGFFAVTISKGFGVGAKVALFLFCVGLGALRLDQSLVPNQFEALFNSTQHFEGYVVEEADIRSNKQNLYFKPKGFSQDILLGTTLAQDFFYGDLLSVEGKVVEPKNFEDFDYKGYLQRYNVYAQMTYPKILILKSSQKNPIKESLLRLKSGFVKKLSQYYKEPQNSLLLGILIGAKKNLPAEISEQFNLTGTSHIIAVSGFNITIMITALALLSRFLGRRFSFWVTLMVILGFVIITGASASVVRAAIMGFLLLLSFNIGRQYSVTPALFLAALVMVAVNPKILFWDVGFQLSFAATLGIVYFSPLLGRLTEKWHEAIIFKSILLTTLSAIIATLPLILFHFGRLSLSAPIVNILVLPVVPLAMGFGFLSTLPLLGPGFAFFADWILIYILKVTALFARMPYSSLDVAINSMVFWLLILGVFILYFFLNAAVKRGEKVVSKDAL